VVEFFWGSPTGHYFPLQLILSDLHIQWNLTKDEQGMGLFRISSAKDSSLFLSAAAGLLECCDIPTSWKIDSKESGYTSVFRCIGVAIKCLTFVAFTTQVGTNQLLPSMTLAM